MSQNNIEKLIGQKAAEMEHVMKVLPMRVGNEAVNFSIQRFRSQNWKDKNKQPWKQRKAKKARGRAIVDIDVNKFEVVGYMTINLLCILRYSRMITGIWAHPESPRNPK